MYEAEKSKTQITPTITEFTIIRNISKYHMIDRKVETEASGKQPT
jgi:hypothetical protein